MMLAAASSPAAGRCLRVAQWIGAVGLEWLVPPLTETYRRAGECVEWVPVPIGQAWQMVESGELDGDMIRVAQIISRMKHVVSVPTEIPGFDAVLITRTTLVPLQSLEDARGMRLAAPFGYLALDLIPGIKDFSIRRETNMSATFQDLAAGEVDGVFTDRNTYLHFIAKGSLDPSALAPSLFVMKMPTHIVLGERQRGKVPAIDRALASVIADGLFAPGASVLHPPAQPFMTE